MAIFKILTTLRILRSLYKRCRRASFRRVLCLLLVYEVVESEPELPKKRKNGKVAIKSIRKKPVI